MPPMPRAEKIWFNGELLNWDDANIHVLSHVVHYGTSVFEGMRCYGTNRGAACFRLIDHVNRIFDSAKIYRMPISYSKNKFSEAILETIRANKFNSCYVRPIIFRGYGSLGVDPTPCPVDVVIATWKWGAYLGEEALEKGASVRFASVRFALFKDALDKFVPDNFARLKFALRRSSPLRSSPFMFASAKSQNWQAPVD